MKQRFFPIIVIAVFALGLVSGKTLQTYVFNESFSVKVNVKFTLIRNGTIIWYFETHNFVTNIGLDFCKQQLGGSPSTDSAKYVSLSTTTQTPVQTWTLLPDELATGGLSRSAGTYLTLGIGQWRIEKIFTATALTTGIRLSGLHWAISGDNTLFAVAICVADTLQASDNFVVQWQISISRSA